MSRCRCRVIVALFVAALLIIDGRGQAASVSGVITAEGGPVADARVTLFTPSLDSFAETRSDASGVYEFLTIDPGPYQLGVAARGYDYEECPIAVSDRPLQQDFALTAETHPGIWEIIGDTLPEFFDATDIGVLLADGTIFYCHDTVDPIRFDPATGEKTFPAGSDAAQGCMNGTLLADGRIIMVGGQDGDDPGSFTDAVPWVKTYDPHADVWTWLPDMQHKAGRWYPGLARLADGSLLVMGGGTAPDAERTETCERVDLESETWDYTGSMLNPSEFTPSALLYSGDVLITWSPPQLYDPQSELWTATGDFQQPLRGWPNHSDHSMVVLDDGDVLAVGVRAADDPDNTIMAERYNPAAEEWMLLSSPDLVRFQTELVQLPDGRIFVGGGETEHHDPPVEDVLGIVRWCDLYDPSEDSWRRVADMTWHREYHAVTMLVPDGRVVTTGGTRIKFQVGPTSADIEAFSPPYLFRGVRPQIKSMSAEIAPRGATLELSIFPQTTITNVVLIGAPATTHWVDGGVPRRLALPVAQTGSEVTATLPTNSNVLPLGHYLLFAMVDDIPSVAEIIQIVQQVPGDTNGDGVVNIIDLLTVLASWGPCSTPPAPCPGDVDGDLTVSFTDLLIVLSSWG